MSGNPKMVMCRNCNAVIASNMKICPSCGAKNKKPFYKRAWFIILMIIVVIGIIAAAGGKKDDTAKLESEIDKLVEDLEDVSNDISSTDEQDMSVEEDANTDDSDTDANEEDVNTDDANTDEKDNKSEELVNGMRPEFKEAMDNYEAFYDDYFKMMKKYEKDPTDLSIMNEYTDMLSKLADMDEMIAAWDISEMNDKELKYFTKVTNRITERLLKISQ